MYSQNTKQAFLKSPELEYISQCWLQNDENHKNIRNISGTEVSGKGKPFKLWFMGLFVRQMYT